MEENVVFDRVAVAFCLKVERRLLLEKPAAVGKVRLDDRADRLVTCRTIGTHTPSNISRAGRLAKLRNDIIANLVKVGVLNSGATSVPVDHDRVAVQSLEGAAVDHRTDSSLDKDCSDSSQAPANT